MLAVSFGTPATSCFCQPDDSASAPRPSVRSLYRETLRLPLSRLGEESSTRIHQDLSFDKYIKGTMICTRVLNRGGKGVRSPADTL